jgi:hypothetical protein
MSFWIHVDVCEKGEVTATTYDLNAAGSPRSQIRVRRGTTVSQALRSLAAAMVVPQKDVKK